MADLVRDWALDPAAILFMASLVFILMLIRRCARLAQHQPSTHRWPVVVFALWLMLFFVSSAPSVVNPLIKTLEGQYPADISCAMGSHLVMLGGGVDSRARSANEFEHMSGSTMARASATARMAKAEPELRLLAAGGALRHVTEADMVANYWITQGIDDSRIIRETRSSSTRDNALKVAQLLSTESVEGPVRLVTSAMHMPRAMQVFRNVLGKQGIEVCPVSVDREALNKVPLWALMPQTTTLAKFDRWLHEVLALGIYRIRGWI